MMDIAQGWYYLERYDIRLIARDDIHHAAVLLQISNEPELCALPLPPTARALQHYTQIMNTIFVLC